MSQRVIDLTLEQYHGNGTMALHGPTPLIFRGPVSHGLTSQRGVVNPYDGTPVSATNEYILIGGHTGTHVDAPSHVDHRSPISVERIPPERTFGPGTWLDLAEGLDEDVAIDPDHLAKAERDGGADIEVGDTVLIHTGWYSCSLQPGHCAESAPGSVSEAAAEGDPHPYLTRASAEWLRARRIKAVGVDTPSPEGHDALDLPVHMNFLRPRSLGLPDEDYILIYENLRRIEAIGPERRFTFFGMPIPFRGGSGSPVRALAVV